MGRRGPVPTPTAVLEKRGSSLVTKRRKAREPKGPPGMPKCPDWLDKRAKMMWRKVSPVLFKMGVLSKIDANALERYCRTYSLWREADEFIQKNGMAYPTKDASGRVTSLQQFPHIGIYNKMGLMLTRLEQEFGLTPSARARLHVDVNAALYDEDDEFFGSPYIKGRKLFGSQAIAQAQRGHDPDLPGVRMKGATSPHFPGLKF